MTPYIPYRQAGVALILSLLLLLVMTLVAVSAMSGINLQERMAGNQKRMTDAQMATEAGVKDFYQWLNFDIEDDYDEDCADCPVPRWYGGADWTEVFPASAAGTANYGDYGYYWIEDWQRWNDGAGVEHGLLTARGQTKAPGTTRTMSELRLEVRFTKKTREDCNLNAEARTLIPALGVLPGNVQFPACGIVTEGQVVLNNIAHLTNANLHSNSDIEQSVYVSSASSTISGGEVTAVGTAEVPASWREQGVVSEGVDHWDIPRITPEMFDAWREFADVVLTDCGTASSPMLIEGDQGGALIFCEGNAHIEGKFNNLNLVVNGNLVHDGALKGEGFEGLATTNFIAANGDITFNGTSGSKQQSFDGIFWSNGTFHQNGRAFMLGAVIAAEAELADDSSDAIFDGNLEFQGLKNRGLFGEIRRLAMTNWRQTW